MTHTPPIERVQRTEDNIAFLQHDFDHISTQTRELHATIAKLCQRVESLEDRLRSFEQQAEANNTPDPLEERPPHAAG